MKAKLVRILVLAVACCLALVLLTPGRARAATFTVSSIQNWSAIVGGPPTSSDDIIVTNGATLKINTDNAVCRNLQIGSGTSPAGVGIISFESGSHLTVSGTIIVGESGRVGSINMSSGGTLTASGFVVTTPGAWTPGTGTVELTGNNTLPSNWMFALNNLTINGTAGTATTLSQNISVSRHLTIASGATLDVSANNRALTVKGNWTNNGGTFNGRDGTVTFNGTTAQVIGGTASTTFSGLIVNNFAGVMLGSDQAVTGLLTLTTNLNTSTYTLSQASSSTSH